MMQKEVGASALEAIMAFLPPAHKQETQADARNPLEERASAADNEKGQVKQGIEEADGVEEEEERPPVLQNLFTPGDVMVLNSAAPLLVKDSLLEDSVLRELLQDVEKVKQSNTLRTAGMGQSEGYWKNSVLRSDRMVWLSPEYCSEHSLHGIKQAMGKMMGVSKQLKQFSNLGFVLNGEVSAQLAVYPPNHTGYVRHLDSNSHRENSAFKGQRIITMVLYLNSDWHAEDGGHLRAFLDSACTINGSGYQDISPFLNRVAIFRSDVVEHQVLPSGKERAAMTVWLYGSAASIPRTPHCQASGVTAHTSNALPLPECGQEQGDIFVSIAAYRDSECQHTIRDLFETAAIPERVFVGVVWQGEPEDEETCFAYLVPDRFNSQVRVMRIPSRDAAGPCWARHLAQSLWQGEEFFLQTDSHMRFRKGWDNYLCFQLRQCEQGGSKPVLTCYPSGYTLPNNVSNDRRPTLLVPHKFGLDGMLRACGKILQEIPDKPVRSPLWAAGLSFSRSSLIAEVPYDRFLMHIFFGEEIAMAARMFTHGYDFYTPPEMVAYHLWSRDHRPSFRQVRQESHERAEARSRQHVQALLQGSVHDGYGLGTARTIAEFEASIHVSFGSSTILPEAAHANLPPSAFASNDDSNAKLDRMKQVLQLMANRMQL